jgi:cytochrome c-type biogenesis protein CcmE
MSSFTQSRITLGASAALLALAVSACGGGQSAQTATPTSIIASPSTFDGQTLSVSGTVKTPATRKTRRGQMLTFQLCDSDTSCIHVLEFGDAAAVTEGQSVSMTGMFRASAGRIKKIDNVLIVGGRPGGGGGAMAPAASAAASADPAASASADPAASTAP